MQFLRCDKKWVTVHIYGKTLMVLSIRVTTFVAIYINDDPIY